MAQKALDIAQERCLRWKDLDHFRQKELVR